MRIGIFGGCFNPPHKMHYDIAKKLLENNYLDKVIYVPTGNKYQKKELINDLDRYNMLLKMTEKEEQIEVSDYEFSHLTYTCETLTYFKQKYPNDEIYFICGSDNLKEIDTWREYHYILKSFNLLVIPRGDNIEKLLEKYKEYKENIKIADIQIEKISSTEIRNILRKGKNEDGLKDKVDEKVLKYIKSKKLYRK